MNQAKTEAIAQADAELNNAGLPTYSELLAALQRSAEYIEAHGTVGSAGFLAALNGRNTALLARAGGAA